MTADAPIDRAALLAALDGILDPKSGKGLNAAGLVRGLILAPGRAGFMLEVPAGEVHAVMGPNGAGKSTLAYVLTGREGYTVTGGAATLDGANLFALAPEARAAAGLFLSFQYPVEIPGVPVMTFVRTAMNAQRRARGEAEISAPDFIRKSREIAKVLTLDPEMLKRPVNVGFSGGEK